MSAGLASSDRGSERPLASLRRAFLAWRPPVDRRQFWAVQLLVIVIAAGHVVLEEAHIIGEHTPVYLLPISLFVIPIMYAALEFGLRGAVQTTVWCGLLSIPNVVIMHEGLYQVGEALQWVGLAVTAFFVGWRVDRERDARLDAENREAARKLSEEQYRAIFDTVDQPIVLLDADGVVREANSAAGRLLDRSVDDLRTQSLPEPFATHAREASRAARGGGTKQRATIVQFEGAWIEVVATPIVDPAGERRLQLILRDVTAEHEREQGLEVVARQALAAREAEQRRIARELHDGPVQSLVLLVRELDSFASSQGDAGAIDDAREVAVRIADQLRRVSRDLRPSILDDLGLPSALGALAHEFGSRTGVRTRLVTKGEPHRLDPSVELMLLRIAEEALRNVERHSGARSARVELTFSGPATSLTIIDDGVGMAEVPSSSTLLGSNRLGLIGMRERARLAGAELTVRPRRPKGLAVRVEVPAGPAGTGAASDLPADRMRFAAPDRQTGFAG